MAFTNFLKPRSITQNTGSSEISWVLDTSVTNEFTGSSSAEPLSSFNAKPTGLLIFGNYATSTRPATRNDSTPTLINGIECKIICSKDARIDDSVIQLARSGSVIGKNKAITSSGEIHTYGGSTDLWGTTISQQLDLAGLQVAVRYKSGSIPHRDSCYVYSVQLKIHHNYE